MAYDLTTFRLTDMVDACRRMRKLDRSHASMEAAASSALDFLHSSLRSGGKSEGRSDCVLVRCFKTHAHAHLPAELQEKVAPLLSLEVRERDPELQCLTLIASRGERPEWNSRHTARAHQVFPLPTVEVVERAPLVMQLILQLGMEIENVIQPQARPGQPNPQTFDIFHVEDALGSIMVPEQHGFIERHGVRSVLGFGGLLPAGELFAVILFARVRIPKETAALFRTLALGMKLILLPHSGRRVFEEAPRAS